MDISIGTILSFLIILFSINTVALMLGVSGEQPNSTISPFMVDGNVTPINQITANNYNIAEGGDYGTDDLASVDASYLPITPYSGNVISSLDLVMYYLKNLTFGYYYIFLNLGLPFLMIMLLSGIIAFMQIVALFFLIYWVISGFRA